MQKKLKRLAIIEGYSVDCCMYFSHTNRMYVYNGYSFHARQMKLLSRTKVSNFLTLPSMSLAQTPESCDETLRAHHTTPRN